jgi:hypothetical protein
MTGNSLGFLHSDFDRTPIRTPAQTRGDMYAHVLGAWRGSGLDSIRARYVRALLERIIALATIDHKHPTLVAERQRIEAELDRSGAIVSGYDMRRYDSLGSGEYFDGVISRIEGRGIYMRAQRISMDVGAILGRLAKQGE